MIGVRFVRRTRGTGPRSATIAGSALLVAIAALPAGGVEATQGPRCTPSPNVAVPDLVQPYRGLPPGLYSGGRMARPEEDAAFGLVQAQRIEPLDTAGKPSPAGRVILLSIGMSNTSAEFERFIQEARAERGVNPRLAIVNGALSGADAAMWASPQSPAWQQLKTTLRGQYGPAQVQAIWMKHAHLRTAPFPDELEQMAANLEATLRTARELFPNLRLVYVSSRTRSGATSRRGPGEPQAYETAFAVRRFIERHQERTATGSGPLVTWGPYLWANAVARSDGLTWECADLQQDLLHPSESGSLKVAQQLMAFLMTDPTATRWFASNERSRPAAPAAATLQASTRQGRAPLAVDFSTDATWPTRHYWNFGDATSSVSPRPRKTFYREGQYEVRLTVTDAAGRLAQSSVQVRVDR